MPMTGMSGVPGVRGVYFATVPFVLLCIVQQSPQGFFPLLWPWSDSVFTMLSERH